ncbi:hypothetical protein BDD12DRAFT_835207 [Trichophaea hybrida]|nr:hypothetical protein BDD12DRAFT_835207 [Trichophaea hybrida]
MSPRRPTLTTRLNLLHNLLSLLLNITLLGRTLLLLPLIGATQLHPALGVLTKYVTLITFSPLPPAISRLLFAWIILPRSVTAQSSAAYAPLVISWSVMGVCRYISYLFPRTAELRRRVEVGLYPVAAASEVWCGGWALKEWGLGYYWWGLVGVVVLYGVGFVMQYRDVVRRRRGRGRRRRAGGWN